MNSGQARRRLLEIPLAALFAVIVTAVVDAIVWPDHPYLALPLLILVYGGMMTVFNVLAKLEQAR